MTALIIIGIILFFVALLLLSFAKVSVKYSDDVEVKVGIGIIGFKVFPLKPKKIKLKDFTAKKYKEKMAKLDQVRAEKEASKKKKLSAKDSDSTEKDAEKGISKVTGIVGLVKELVLEAVSYTSHIHTGVKKLYVSVGSPDAAKTAIMYSLVAQSVAYLIEFLDCHTTLGKIKDGAVSIEYNFLSESIVFEADISIKIRIINIIRLGISLLTVKIKHDINKNKNSVSERKVGIKNG